MAAQGVLPTATRARLIAMQAQIEMWRFSEMKRARRLLDQAKSLSPDDTWILSTVGDHQLKSGEPDQAEASYRRAIEIAPGDPSGYVGMGSRCEKEPALDQAEAWYRQAIARAAGDPAGYENLALLLARVDYRRNATQISDLMARRNAIDPEGEYDAYLTLSNTCAEVGLAKEALDWCERARSFAPDLPRAYLSLADLSNARGDAANAEALAGKAVNLAPVRAGVYGADARQTRRLRHGAARVAGRVEGRVPRRPGANLCSRRH